jgi:outer membrane protein
MKKYWLVGLFVFLGVYCQCQERRTICLADIIKLAQTQSPRYQLEKTKKEISYYEFLNYKSDLKPQVSLYGQVPVYTKKYTSVVQPDGTINFLPVNQHYSDVGFSLSQRLPFTGGNISLNTDLNRFDDLKTRYKQYNGTPVFIRFNQSLFSFNELKWKKRIEPLKLEESRRTYVLEMENIAQQCVRWYFDVLDAQSNMGIAMGNLSNSKINYDIEKKRIDLGTTTEDKILQLELQVLKNQQELEKAKYEYKTALLNLRTFIGDTGSGDLNLELPEKIPVFEVNTSEAITMAKQNRPEYIAFERKKKEAQRDVAQAKASNRQINVTASYGLNRAADELGTIYNDPKSQQLFSIGFNVPVLDWGRRKNRYNTAIAMEKLVNFNNDLDDAGVLQEVITLVNNIELLKGNIALAVITDSVALRRYEIANRLFQSGKFTITELHLAQSEKDNARRSYISSFRSYWNAYYLLRKLTMFDFVTRGTLYK